MPGTHAELTRDTRTTGPDVARRRGGRALVTAGVVILGTAAGLLPGLPAARMSLAEALWTPVTPASHRAGTMAGWPIRSSDETCTRGRPGITTGSGSRTRPT